MTPENLESTTAGGPAADPTPHITVDGFEGRIPEIIDLDAPREGVPLVIDTMSGLERCAAAIAAGSGPAGVDAERASGFRYGQRAFLVQIRRDGAGTWLIDTRMGGYGRRPPGPSALWEPQRPPSRS